MRWFGSFPSSDLVLLSRGRHDIRLALHRLLHVLVAGAVRGTGVPLTGGSDNLAGIETTVADLVGGVVEEVGKLAEHLGLEVELLLLLAPVVDGLLQMFQSVIHIVVEGLESVKRFVVALVNDMPKVCHAEGAETAENGSGVKILKKGKTAAYSRRLIRIAGNLQESEGPAADSSWAPRSHTDFADSGGTGGLPDFLK